MNYCAVGLLREKQIYSSWQLPSWPIAVIKK